MQDRRGQRVRFGPEPRPGAAAGDCPECGERTVFIGHDATVVGALCEECELVVGLGVRFVDVHDAYGDPHPPGEPSSVLASDGSGSGAHGFGEPRGPNE